MNTESFDFIIAGGGTAGIALASRLSEVDDHTVLVLEAGVDHSDDPRVKIPAFYSALIGTDVDWGFKTVAQPQLKGRSISLSQGKALGGSSVMNAQVYAPPTEAILNAWAELGNDGWGWDTMGPYYTKALTSPHTPNDLRRALGIDGWWADEMDTSGPVQLSYPGNPSHPIRQIWAETFERKRYLMTSGVWGDASVGAFSNLASVDPVSRERCHAAKAYYAPIRDRKNLQVLLNAPVDKILFADGEAQPKAIGVQYYHEGEMKTVKARKEVIICAGALQSPKLLELSGIGNAEILKQHNIEVIKDLPGVGENLQDHLVCDMTFAAIDEMETLDALARQEPKALEQAMISFTQNHDGPLTSCGIKTYAYLPIIDFLEGSGRDQLVRLIDENRLAATSLPENSKARKYYELVENMLLDPNKPSAAYLSAIGQISLGSDPETGKPASPQPGNHLTIATVLAQPLSRGTVHIVSTDSKEAPEIDPRYLSNPLDVEVFAQHVMYLKSIASSAPLSDVLKQPLQAYPPLAHLSDLEATKRYIQSRTISMWHPAGTCAMLPEQIGGVVDSSLRVYGVSNLRVVDASIVPLLPPGNLQSTIYAVAERAADLIEAAHKPKTEEIDSSPILS
ncbi:oxidoreductase [Xylaria digitata]|nr:oxidoreductase [Xylaria digitata]